MFWRMAVPTCYAMLLVVWGKWNNIWSTLNPVMITMKLLSAHCPQELYSPDLSFHNVCESRDISARSATQPDLLFVYLLPTELLQTARNEPQSNKRVSCSLNAYLRRSCCLREKHHGLDKWLHATAQTLCVVLSNFQTLKLFQCKSHNGLP